MKPAKRRSVFFKTPKRTNKNSLKIHPKTPMRINPTKKIKKVTQTLKKETSDSDIVNIDSSNSNTNSSISNNSNSSKNDNYNNKSNDNNIKNLNEKQTITELKTTIDKILKIKTSDTIKSKLSSNSKLIGLDNEGVIEILQKFFNLKLIEIENQNSKINKNLKSFKFEFKTKKRNFSFILSDDEKYLDSFSYELIENRNCKLPEFMNVNITFKKELVMRFFMEVFVAMSASDK